MKKMYFLLAIAFMFVLEIQAQTLLWTDAMNYPLGPVHEGRWGSWSGNPGAEDLLMVNNGPAQMDPNVGYIGNAGQDAVLKLGNQTSGGFILTWFMHIPPNKSSYFSILKNENPQGNSSTIAVHVYFNQNGNTPGLGSIYNSSGTLLANFQYGTGGIMFFRFDVNLNNDTVKFYQGDGSGNVAYDGPLYSDGGNLGGINFWRFNNNTEFFVDTFQFWSVEVLDTEDFAADAFSFYPNPVKDFLNFNSKTAIDGIEVYDIMGKKVLQENPQSISPSIDMSNLVAGTYFAKVTIGDASKTLKIIKK